MRIHEEAMQNREQKRVIFRTSREEIEILHAMLERVSETFPSKVAWEQWCRIKNMKRVMGEYLGTTKPKVPNPATEQCPICKRMLVSVKGLENHYLNVHPDTKFVLVP